MQRLDREGHEMGCWSSPLAMGWLCAGGSAGVGCGRGGAGGCPAWDAEGWGWEAGRPVGSPGGQAVAEAQACVCRSAQSCRAAQRSH